MQAPPVDLLIRPVASEMLPTQAPGLGQGSRAKSSEQ
jgi:hypothetical protein